MNASSQIENPDYSARVTKLQAAIKYAEDDLQNAKILIEQCPADDPDTQVNLACILSKENRHDEATKAFTAGLQYQGYKADLAYNIALSHYQQSQFSQALKHIAEIIERGVKEHPELGVGVVTEGMEVRSVGNTWALHESCLVEAFNLKSAIEYSLKNWDAAVEALTDMPPRNEEDLDPVTLHNHALMNMESKPSEGFAKLQFLLQQTHLFPTETFQNILLLYCKYEYYELAADVLAENAHLTYKYLTPYLYDFMDAMITQQTSPTEAYRKFDEIATKQTETLRKLTKQVQECRQSQDEEGMKRAVRAYDEALEKYLPVLMGQAKIYWDLGEYQKVEKVSKLLVKSYMHYLNLIAVLVVRSGVQKVSRVLQRTRHLEAQCCSRLVHAGVKVQRSFKVLRADHQEALRPHTRHQCHCFGQLVCLLHYDQSSTNLRFSKLG